MGKEATLPHLIFIAWCYRVVENKWIDVKIYNTMRDVDRQADAIKKIWEEDDRREPNSRGDRSIWR